MLAPLRLHYHDGSCSTPGATLISCTKEYSTPLFTKTGVDTVFENLEGVPTDWKTNAPAFVKFVREHQCPSFPEYGEYPFVSADEIKKALKLKATFSSMLDQMQ